MAKWEGRLSWGEHDEGLGVGVWVIGVNEGSQQLGRVMAWNWYQNKGLWLKVDYWEGVWGKRYQGCDQAGQRGPSLAQAVPLLY